jgi:hypothetical protein
MRQRIYEPLGKVYYIIENTICVICSYVILHGRLSLKATSQHIQKQGKQTASIFTQSVL